MLRTALSVTFATLATNAFAHGGHIADVGHGHSHFEGVIALAAIGIIATIIIKKRFYS